MDLTIAFCLKVNIRYKTALFITIVMNINNNELASQLSMMSPTVKNRIVSISIITAEY